MESQILILTLTSIVSILLLLIRFIYSQDPIHNYLLLNLILAWIPYILALVIWQVDSSNKRINKTTILAGFLWLLFFPNAPYIITDFVHLVYAPPIPLWFDSMMLSAFAFHGIILGVASLQLMKYIVQKRCGVLISQIFVTVAVALMSVGIYVGRFLRWNSWDVVTNPQKIVQFLTQQSLYIQDHPRVILFVSTFSLFFFVCYLLFGPLLRLRAIQSLTED